MRSLRSRLVVRGGFAAGYRCQCIVLRLVLRTKVILIFNFTLSEVYNFVFFLILAFIVADYVFGTVLDKLNASWFSKPLPPVLQGIYDNEKYSRQQKYSYENYKFGIVSSTFSVIVLLVCYGCGLFGWLDSVLRTFIGNELLVTLAFFGIIIVANGLINLPFEYYDNFVIEEKYGFNKSTKLLFFADKLKELLVTIVLGGGILALVAWLYSLAPQWFWLSAWAVVAAFSIFMQMFYSQLIVPLFNKQTPLAAGGLRTAIEDFAAKAGFELKNIYVIDSSKRTTKANAYFTGLGAKKRIVLYDTLMDKMVTDEIVAVLAHEVGHYKHRHTLASFLLNVPYMLLLFYFFGYVLQSDVFAQALGGQQASFHLNALAFSILYSPITFVLDVGLNALSRRFEYQADGYAASQGTGTQLVSALKKLTSTSLGNLMPHPLYAFFYYSHPTLEQRIAFLTTKRKE